MSRFISRHLEFIFSLTLFGIISTGMSFALPVMVVLPLEEPISLGWDTGLVEDLFLARLTGSDQFVVRADRSASVINQELKLGFSGYTSDPIEGVSRPDADIVTSLLIGEWNDGIRLYARVWMARDGSALLALMRPINPATYEQDVIALADELIFTLSTYIGDTAAISSRILLSKGYFEEAESIMQARWLSEGSSPELRSDLDNLKRERILRMRVQLDSALKEELPDYALLIFNDLYRLDPFAGDLKEYSERLRALFDKQNEEISSSLDKEAFKAYKGSNIDQGDRLFYSLATGYIQTDTAENLEELLFSRNRAVSNAFLDKAEFFINDLKQQDDTRESIQISDRALTAAAQAVIFHPEYQKNIRILEKSGETNLNAVREYERAFSDQPRWKDTVQDPRFTYSIAYTRAPYLPPPSSDSSNAGSVQGVEVGVSLNFPYKTAWAFNLLPSISYEWGTESGSAGSYSWCGQNNTFWMTLEGGVHYRLRYFHIEAGPTFRAGFGSQETHWSSGDSDNSFVFSYAIGGFLDVTAYPVPGIGLGLRFRATGTRPDSYPWYFHPEILFRTVIDIEGF